MEANVDKLIEKIRGYAKKSLKEKRFEHSVRVAQTAAQMCSLYGADEKKGYLAGIAHDICKSMNDEELLALAAEDGNPVSEIERSRPALLHGRAAAVLLQKKFGICDGDVLQAVACHTFGAPDLCPLAKIVYAADKIEPGRPQSTEAYREKLFSQSLNSLVLSVLRENLGWLKTKGKSIASSSFEFEKSLGQDSAAEGKNECF
ncbi:MAG: bis(5'-nucleosyl)-tetraphosphatase (symmetrical) YqeK [Treponema sp.]|nr:bis(5'-nucleosyl)-tetraphosphatase (symmetrical) YqeK [Treponema sp.]